MIRGIVAVSLSIVLGACTTGPVQRESIVPVYAPAPSPAGPLARLETDWLRSASGPEVSGLVLLDKNQAGLESRLMLVDTATSSLDLQYYFWWVDDSGLLLLQRVLAAADRGVRVRLILDDLLVIGQDDALAALETHPNIEIRLFNIWQRRSLAGRGIEGLRRFGQLNHRMHNKLLVADNRVVILGGRNIGNEYFGLKDRFNFRDLDILGVGPIARQASVLFDNFWNSPWTIPVGDISERKTAADLENVRSRIAAELAKSTKLTHLPGPGKTWTNELDQLGSDLIPGTTQVIYDDVSAVEIKRNMVSWTKRLFETAKREALVTNAYIILTDQNIEQVARITSAGVRIRILTNSLESNDVPAVNSHYKKWRKPLLTGGAELYELRADADIRTLTDTPPVKAEFAGLHTKAMVVDRRYVFVGSMNLDPRSAVLNTEMGVLIDSPPLAEQLAALMEDDMRPDRSWKVGLDPAGTLTWTSDRGTLTSQPARSSWQRFQDVLFGLAPEQWY